MPVAEISPYRILPQSGYSQETGFYNPVAFLQNQAQQYNAVLPPMPAVPAAQPLNIPGNGPNGTVSKGKPEWARLLDEASSRQDFTPEAFDALATEFKRARVEPIAALKGMSEAQRDAFIGGFDAQAAKDKARLFKNLASAAKQEETKAEDTSKESGLGRDTYNLGKSALATVGSGVANTLGLLLAGADRANIVGNSLSNLVDRLTGNEGRTQAQRQKFIDSVFKYLVDPDRRAENFLGGKSAEQLAQEAVALPKTDPRYADRLKKTTDLYKQLIQDNAGTSFRGALEREREQASAESPIASGVGTGIGIIAEALLTRRIPGIGQLLEGSRGANLGRRILSELPVGAAIGSQLSGETAVSNVNRGDDLTNVLAQYGLDTGLNTALAALPPSLRGNLLTRLASGAGIAGVQSEIQSGLDAAVNPNNSYTPLAAVNTPEGIANLIVGAGLGGLAGGRPAGQGRVNKNGKKNAPAPQTQRAGAQAAPDATATPAAADIQTANVGAWEAPAATPLADEPLANLTTKLEGKLKTRTTRYKKSVPKLESADELVNAAVDETQELLGDSWNKLTDAQRVDMVEKTVEGMRGRSKLEGIPEAFINLKNRVLASSTAAPISALDNTNLGNRTPDQIRELLVAQKPNDTFDHMRYIADESPLSESEVEALHKALPDRTAEQNAATNPKDARLIISMNDAVPQDIRTAQTETIQKRKTGKKQEKAAFQKTDTTPKITRTPNTQNDYYKSLFNYAAGNEKAMFGNVTVEQVSNDPNLNAIKEGIKSGNVTDVATMQGYLENRGLEQDKTSPKSKGENDNRTISKLISSGKKNDVPAKTEARSLSARGKELGLKANEMKNMTLAALRSSVDELETKLGNKAPPKTTPKRKTGKKVEKAKVETKPEDTTPKPTAAKTPESMKLHELEEGLNEQGSTLSKRTQAIKKLKREADTLESEVLGLQQVRYEQVGKGGGRTRAELRDMTVAELEKYRNELRADNKESLDKKAAQEKERADKIKAAQEKQKSIKINRAHNDGMGDILALGKTGTDGAIESLDKDNVAAIQKLFSQAVSDGKTSALRDSLTKNNVYGEKIDSIISAAKNAHEAELNRVKDAVDADGKPLPKTAKSKILKGFLDYKSGDLSKTKFRDLVQELTRDETGKGIESRLIELADQEKSQLADSLKKLETNKESPSPKAQAPKKGAAKKQNVPLRKLSQKAKTLDQRISETLDKSDLSRTERNELDAAIRLAQEGDSAELNKVLKDLVDAESLTNAQAKLIRGIGQEKATKPLQATKESIDELLKGQEDNIDGDLDPQEQVAQQQRARLNTPTNDIYFVDDTPSGKMARAMDLVWERAEQGKLTPQEAQAQISVLKKDYDASVERARLAETNTPERGPEAVRKRLQQIKQANAGNKHVEGIVNFTNWLIDQNPNLVNRVNLALAEVRSGGSGRHNVSAENGRKVLNITLNTDLERVNHTTAVHEILHSSERMMPKELQDKIRGEYTGRLLNKIKQVQRNGRLAELDYLRDVIKYLAAPTKSNYENAISHILQGKVGKDEFYKYINSSEYWAEEGSKILARRFREGNTWLPRLKEWTREFIEHVKAAFGYDNNSKIYKGLKDVLTTDGNIRVGRGLRDSGINADELPDFDITDVDEASRRDLDKNGLNVENPQDEDTVYERSDTEARASNNALREATVKTWKDIGWFQKAWENMAYAGYALEKAKQEFAKNKITLDFDIDPAEQLRLKDGRTSRNNEIDNNEVVNPVDDYLENNWEAYANDKREFISKLNDFFGLTNLMERAHTAWLHNVKLTDGKGFTRDNIIEDVREGNITPEAGRSKLEALVKKYADYPEKQYIEDYIPEIDEYTDRLKELKDEGIDQTSMSELNELLDDVRNRQRERLVESGQVNDKDVWTRFYGWKWYVPLKGSSTMDADPRAQATFDIIPSDKLALAKLNSQYKAMQGRGTEGERPFERLFVDLARSGERAANGHFMRSLYELSLTHQKELGAFIYTLEGNPHDGYTDSKGNVFAKLPTPKDGLGFIVNDGDVHHAITLHGARKSGDSAAAQIIRGLVMSNDILRPTGGLKKVATVTNTLARNYTTMSPTWQLFKGFVRDLTTIPVTMSVENFSGPLQSAEFNTNFVKELTTSYGSLKVLVKQLGKGLQDKGVFQSIDELASKDPNSYAGWVKRYLDNGGSNAFTQGFELESVNRNFIKSLRNKAAIAANTENSVSERAAAAAGVALTPYTKWGELTSNWAQFLELVPRVAAFRAYAETKGVSDAEAAVAVRRVMDYQQSGRYGRNINSLLAFYRTAMTSADVIRRALITKEGKFDAVKAGKWATVMPVFGYAAYQAVAAALGDDEDGIAKMKKLRASTLTQYMVLPFTDAQGRPYGASIGLGLPQVLMAPGALAAALEAGHITEEQALEELALTYKRNLTPINRETISTSLTATQPIVDLDRNRDAFDRPIHTDFEDKKKPRWQQGRQNTADLYKDIAKFVYNTSDKATAGMYQSNMYPEDIRYLVSSYGGQTVTDLMKKFVDAPELEEGGIADTSNPLSSRAVIKDSDYYDVERLYRLLDEYNSLERKVNNETEGDPERKSKYLQDNPDIAKALKAGKELQSARTKRDKNIKALRGDNNSLGRRAALRKQYDSSLREASNKLERFLDNM